jgi:hypothetical protein
VLSIRQPYADFILCGTKWCENGTWRTQHRGSLWIHASKLEKREVRDWQEKGIDLARESPVGLRTGAIIGRVQLIGCVDGDELWDFHDGRPAPIADAYAEFLHRQKVWDDVSGPWCFLLDKPEPCQPVSCAGWLNIWTFGRA